MGDRLLSAVMEWAEMNTGSIQRVELVYFLPRVRDHKTCNSMHLINSGGRQELTSVQSEATPGIESVLRKPPEMMGLVNAPCLAA